MGRKDDNAALEVEDKRGKPFLGPGEVKKLVLRLKEQSLRYQLGELCVFQEIAEAVGDKETRLTLTQLGLYLSRELAEVQVLLHDLAFTEVVKKQNE